MNDLCLLLTATIEVQNKALVKRSDTATRLEDYKRSLRQWLGSQKSLAKMVFVENSGYPLDELKELAAKHNPLKKEIEFLSFKYSGEGDRDISMGEIRAIEHAVKHSATIAAHRAFVKVTGRVFVRNIDSIVSSLYDDFHIVARLAENLMYLDSVIAIFEKECYKNTIQPFVIEQMSAASERIDFESVYARAVHYALSRNYRWYPLPHEPVLDGMSATKNIPYASKYGRAHGMAVDLVSSLYHTFFRTAFSRSNGREHIAKRWNIEPKSH